MAHYDMLVIGSGPAGQKAAIQAAKVGKRVGIVERKKVAGGICINTGTIPSKSLREAVLFLSGFRQRNLYGASYRVKERHHLRGPCRALRSRGEGGAGGHPAPTASEPRGFHRRHRKLSRPAPALDQTRLGNQRAYRGLYRGCRGHGDGAPSGDRFRLGIDH